MDTDREKLIAAILALLETANRQELEFVSNIKAIDLL